jgi:hypothetical protein
MSSNERTCAWPLRRYAARTRSSAAVMLATRFRAGSPRRIIWSRNPTGSREAIWSIPSSIMSAARDLNVTGGCFQSWSSCSTRRS